MKQATCIFGIIVITFAAILTPLVKSEDNVTSHVLGIKPQLERKDTRMLCLEGCPLYGPDAWDIVHEDRGSHNPEERCIKAAVSMVDSYYGGHLSQDRIAYYVYHEYLNWESPQRDLGHGIGITNIGIPGLLFWALNGSSVARYMGKPDFFEIKYWLDLDMPIIRDHGERHLITVIDGYDTEGQMVYLIDPSTGTESKVPYDSLDVFVVWVIMADNTMARSDEPTIWMDSDGDGVVDFDEVNRFHTDPYNNDTYGLGIDDKTLIKFLYIDHLAFPTATFKCSTETPSPKEQIVFNATECKGNITAYRWNFGDTDVTIVNGPIVSHAYDEQGKYNVTLTVMDNNGLWNITTSQVIVSLQNQNNNHNVSDTAFYRQSLDRRGFAVTEGPESPDLLWVSYLNDSVTTSPAVADGMVFVGTSSGTFYALDLTTGEIEWSLSVGSSVSSSPAFRDGMVFFGTENPGRIYALDAYTGLVRWLYQVPTGDAVYSSPAVVDDMVIVGCSDGNLLCLDQWEGQVLWAAHLGGGYVSSPAIQDGVVFVASSLGVDAVDMLTGNLIWEFETSWPVISCPAVADGLVFVGSDNNDRVYALEQSTGEPVWVFLTGGWLTPPAVDSAKQFVIVGSKDLRLYCLEEYTGYLKWQYLNGTNYLLEPTISANGLVYVGTSDGNLHCINEDTGEEIWRYQLTAPTVSSVSLVHQHILTASLDGRVYCFGPQFAVHNIAVSNLTQSSRIVVQGDSLQINATVENQGNLAETFDVTVYANGTPIETKKTTLSNASSVTLVFVWDTTRFAYGNYTISAYATPVSDETNTTDNIYVGGIVRVFAMPVPSFNYSPATPRLNELIIFNASASYELDGSIVSYAWDFGDSNITIIDQPVIAHAYTKSGNYTVTLSVTDNDGLQNANASLVTVKAGLLGDINGDGTTDIYDAIILAGAYNSKPSEPNWNPNADINGDNTVDIYDAIILAGHYGEKSS